MGVGKFRRRARPTLRDVVGFAHNTTDEREFNSGDHSDNLSCNWGVRPTDENHRSTKRAMVLRAMLAAVFFSAGTPMLLAGYEFGCSQGATTIHAGDAWPDRDWRQRRQEPR